MALLVYITCPDFKEAQKIATAVVEERLAACGNILPSMHSIYRWQGKVEEAGEVVLLLKTNEATYPRLEARVLELHSYDCPCVVALPLQHGSKAYLAWIDESC